MKKNLLLQLSVLVLLFSGNAIAQMQILVKDINPTSAVPYPSPYSLYQTEIGLFISGYDNSGNSFYTLDTVANVIHHVSSQSFYNPVEFNHHIYFSGYENNPNSGSELWITDGTTSGTYVLKDISEGSSSSIPMNLVVTSDHIFFFATTPSQGTELWKSDGTVMVKDIMQGKKSSIDKMYPFMMVFGNRVLFAANDGTTGSELFISDGTSAGTFLVKNITTGNANTYFYSGAVLNGVAYFFAGSSPTDLKLWKSDRTSAGTVMVKDFDPSSTKEKLVDIKAVNNHLLIIAEQASTGIELWSSDGTTSGTNILKDIKPGPGSAFSATSQLTIIHNKCYFDASSGSSHQPWVSDGTLTGTYQLTTIIPLPVQTATFSFAPLNADSIIIGVDDRLLRSDGVTSTTVDLTSALPADIAISVLKNLNGKVYFLLAPDYNVVWCTDGSLSGTKTTPLAESNTASSFPGIFASVSDGKHVFTAYDGVTNQAIYVTDATANGTMLLKSLGFDLLQLSPHSANGKAFFTYGNDHPQLWVTDGTSPGTQLVNNDYGSVSYIDEKSVAGNNVLFYIMGESDSLWRTDGTAPGTYSLMNPRLGAEVII